jgi:hypothetical protein
MSLLRKNAKKNIKENTTLKTREDQTNTMKAKALKSAKKLVSRMYSHIKSYSGTEPKKDKLTQAYKHYKDRVEKPVMYDPRYKIKTKSTVTGKEEPMVLGRIPSQGRYERNLNNLGVKLAKQKSAELRQKDRDDAVSRNKRKDIKENTTLKTREDQRRSAIDHADKLRRKHLSRSYTLYKKEYGEPDRDSFEDGAAYLKHVPNSDLPSHIPTSKKMKTRDSRQPQVRVKKMDAALHNLRRKSIIARNADIDQWHRDNKVKDRRKDINESRRALKTGKAIVAAAGIGAVGLLGHHLLKNRPPQITKSKQVDNVPKNQQEVDDELKIMRNKKLREGNLHAWFSKSKSKDGKSGWVNVVTGGTCASDKPGEGTPKCVSSAKRASMSKSERLSAQRRKKAADPNQQSKSGGAKPTYVKTDLKEADIKGKNSGKKDACYHKVKARYRVWPSAYASGALAKCRKAGSKKWGSK